MTEFKATITHACGHQQEHEGGSTDVPGTLAYMATELCGHCRPRCGYCGRVGLRAGGFETPDRGWYCRAWCAEQALAPTHYREHNEIAIPAFLSGPEWEDHSYHNDLCGRSFRQVGGDPYRGIVVCVDRDNRQDREEGLAKYNVVWAESDDTDTWITRYTGEDADLAQAAIAALLAGA